MKRAGLVVLSVNQRLQNVLFIKHEIVMKRRLSDVCPFEGREGDDEAYVQRMAAQEIVCGNLATPSDAVMEVALRLVAREEYERCDYLTTLCEQLEQRIEPGYVCGNIVVHVLDKPCLARALERALYSPAGGASFLEGCLDDWDESFAEMVLRLHREGVELSVLTRLLSEEKDDEEGRLEDWKDQAQCAGFECDGPEVLQWLVRDGLFCDDSLDPVSMCVVANRAGLTLLLDAGFSPNHATGIVQPLCCQSSADMVDALLEAGARIELLTGAMLPTAVAFRRMLQLQPQATRAKFPADAIVRLEPQDSWLEVVEVMHEFGYPAPDLAGVPLDVNELAAVLFTFEYTSARPLVGQMLWRRHTHHASDPLTKQRVATALLCMKRACPRLPKNIRNLLLLEAFGKVRFEQQ